MFKLLLPVDGSPASVRAAHFAAALAPQVRDLEVHLVNVQETVDAWEVRRFLSEEEIAAMQRQRGEEALAGAQAVLREAGVTAVPHLAVGDVSETIARLVDDLACRQVVMGTHGHGAMSGLLLGSVSTKVLHRVQVPVTLVK